MAEKTTAQLDLEIRKKNLETQREYLTNSQDYVAQCKNGVQSAEVRLMSAKEDNMQALRAVELAENDLRAFNLSILAAAQLKARKQHLGED